MMDHEKNAEMPAEASPETTIIGRTFTFEGELEANEDTLILGRVEGHILVENYTLRIGRTGDVKGEVFAKNVIAEGSIEGQLSAKEKIVLRETAKVSGKIRAPQVEMTEGCQFNGEVEMGAAATAVASKRSSGNQEGSD